MDTFEGGRSDFSSENRKTQRWHPGVAYLSVLHVLGEGFVDIKSAFNYSPKTPGYPAAAGELLMARINPRIPRICVVPDLGVETLCSSEFVIMKVREPLDAYTLAYLLQTDIVQSQIRSLTSGTSASHNRIRTSDLSLVLIPIPRSDSNKAGLVDTIASEYREALKNLAKSTMKLAGIRSQDVDVFPG